MTIKRMRTPQANPQSDSYNTYPKLRKNIEPIPIQTKDGSVLFGLKDSIGLASDIVWLPQDLFYVLRFFDGKHSYLDIKAEYLRKFGTFLFDENLLKLVNHLDENYMLDNDRTLQRIKQIVDDYRNLPARKSICADNCYAAEADALKAELDTFTKHIDNPEQYNNFFGQHIKAIIAPHIDIRLGGHVYAHPYYILRNAAPVDLYVILGIGHQGISNLFALTEKDFDTPLGTVPTDASLVRQINDTCEFDFLQEEIIHLNEHSIEFQTIFLKYFAPGNYKILPILCSFPPSIFTTDGIERQIFDLFVDGLKTVLSNYQGNICFVASIDFAHVGPQYGDSFQPSPAFMARVERNDRNILQALTHYDKKAFQEQFIPNDNQYRICGYSALSTLLSVMEPATGHLLAYDSAQMDSSKSTVTFASMIFI